jgi:type 1 glutamine amidotransferase/HEAT repeat protein
LGDFGPAIAKPSAIINADSTGGIWQDRWRINHEDRMSLSRLFHFGLAALLLTVSQHAMFAAEPQVRVLILSGQNNHDWRTTTPKLKAILAGRARFTVEVTEHPEQCDAAALAKYDVLLSDWNTFGKPAVTNWPAATRKAFLDFVRGGKGLVVVHAGGSSFYDWPEYQQIAGVYWDLAKTSHGAPHEFSVEMDAQHPVTRGLAPFKTRDELWLKPGVHPAAKVIATGEGQPLVMATELGKGRGFAMLLGHSADFMETPGFQTLLLRGAEWAATGKVTIRSANDASALDFDQIIKRAAAYRFGDDRKPVLALERLVFAASDDPTTRAKLAAKLAGALSSDATVEGKVSFCQGLSLLGTIAEVPALAKALTDTNLFYHARQALERIPAAEAAAALQTAMAGTTGARASLINSLAARRAEKALPDIAKFVADTDLEVAGAAMDALGQLGGIEAARALQSAEGQLAPELRGRFAVALLRCAESLQTSGKADDAAALFAKLAAPGQPAYIRVAAFPWHEAAGGERGSALVLAALMDKDEAMQSAAIRALRARQRPALVSAVAEQLEKIPAELREAIVVLCGEQGDAADVPVLVKAAANSDVAVRHAAIRALGLVGDHSAVKPLVELSASASDDEKKALVESLARLRGLGVEDALAGALPTAPVVAQSMIIRALVAREARTTVAALLPLAVGHDAGVRREAITALGKLADANACGPMLQLLEKAAEREKGWLEGALVEICRHDAAAISVIAVALPKAAPAESLVLLGVLGSVGGEPACEAIRSQLKSGHAEVCLAAVRALADWPDASPLDDLAALVETTNDPKLRALAARGLNRMVPRAPARATQAAQALARALGAATDAAEQKSLLAALVAIPSVPSLLAAQAQLKHSALAAEAASGLVKIGEIIYPWHRAEVEAALAGFKPADPTLAKRAAALSVKLGQPANLAIGGLVTSPDGLEKDGAAGGDQAAIDGDPATYWDEEDGHKLYVLRVQLREHSTVGCLRMMGYQQHSYAPKDFEVLIDGKVVKKVTDAQYQNNWLTVEFPPVGCEVVELKITGYYGQSPAIRELEIYEKPLLK